MCEENTRCGSYDQVYRNIHERRIDLLSKITNGVDNYHTHAIWQKVVDSLAMGADPLMIIEQLIDINIVQSERMRDIVTHHAQPMRVSVDMFPGAVIWIPIDKYKLPTGEVLAKNSRKDILVGRLGLDKFTGIVCDSEESQLINVTHYITIENLLKL